MTDTTFIPSAPREQEIDTEVGRLFLRVSGQGPAVLLWPALFTDHTIYDELVSLLRDRYTLVAINPPGHGRNSLSERPLTLAACVRATFSVLDVLGLRSVDWVGTSWGGLVGGEAAILFPARVRRLFCLNTPFHMPISVPFSTRVLVWMSRFMPNTNLFARRVAKAFFSEDTRRHKAHLVQNHGRVLTRGNRHFLYRAARFIFVERASSLPSLARIQVPTVVVAGRADRQYSVSSQAEAAQRIAQARFIALEGSAHISVADKPDVIAKLVVENRAQSTDISRNKKGGDER